MNSVSLSHSLQVGKANRIVGVLFSLAATLSPAMLTGQSLGDQVPRNRGLGYTTAIPYDGSTQDALDASAAGTTIPMASFTFTATKDGLTYTDVVVGANPFSTNHTTTTVNVLLVPIIVQIGSTVFDPTQPDACIVPEMSPLTAVEQSPVLQKVVFDGGAGAGHAATMNGVNVGTTTYPDAFRRAEFWNEVAGTNYHTAFNLSVALPWTITSSVVKEMGGASVFSTGCSPIAVLDFYGLFNYIRSAVIPGISAITPNTFALFLFKNVVSTTSTPLDCTNGCTLGYHGALGTPVQTYGVSEYDTTQLFWHQRGLTNISVIAHEVSEWMDDPLGTNPTPLWGNIGQVSACQSNWEVGDPLTSTNFPAITMPNGVNYDPQELAFWSWYYNAENTPSIGAGGKFSDNRTFAGPSKVCPPGGTY